MRTGWLSCVRANDKTIIDMLANQGANLVKATSSLVELLISTAPVFYIGVNRLYRSHRGSILVIE